MKHTYTHQLVIEFPCESIEGWDEIVELELLLDTKTSPSEQVDGHDSGGGS